MNCVDFQELLQRCLDGEPVASDRGDLAAHVALCPDCRDLHSAAQYLLAGLRILAPPRPPADLAERICKRIVTERARAARIRRLLVTTAVAASLLLTCYAMYMASRATWTAKPSTELAELQPPTSKASPSLNRRIEEAGWAVVALTRQTADETVGQTKLLLPVGIPDAAVGDVRDLEQALEPPARSLREIQEGMSAGLEPVASSARRAIGFFWREIPPVESRMQ